MKRRTEPDIPGVCYRKDSGPVISAPYVSAEIRQTLIQISIQTPRRQDCHTSKRAAAAPFPAILPFSARKVRYFDEAGERKYSAPAKSGAKTVKWSTDI